MLQGLREFGRACPQLVVQTFTELMQRSTGEGGVPLADSQLARLFAADGFVQRADDFRNGADAAHLPFDRERLCP